MKVLAPPRAVGLGGPVRSSPPVADTGGVDSPVDGWTVADLDQLPDDGRRYEIIDGSLVMSPSPAMFHQRMTRWLAHTLLTDMPAGFDVVENMGVRLADEPGQFLIPDVCAVRSPTSILDEERTTLAIGDVRLVVEVVSPS
jgi:Uma2 family endonuclease